MDRTEDILQECAAMAARVFQEDQSGSMARDAALYLAHTGAGESIRKLAEAAGTHPSTVMRAVRRIEQNRDDPLFERLLVEAEGTGGTRDVPIRPGIANRDHQPALDDVPLPEADVRREAKRFLRRLSEPGAFLLIANHAEKAGIFCAANGHRRPIALLDVPVAAEFLKREWIKANSRGSATVRYQITDVGRSFLRRALAEDQPARGFSEAVTPFAHQHKEMGERLFADAAGTPEAKPVNLGECPVGWLARRKGPDGQAFLGPELVDAAEKLRDDFEAAQLGPQVAQDWRKFLTPGGKGSGGPVPGPGMGGSMDARERVGAALTALGPGLADVALRACCFLEGLEACERRHGWSARSGKVVLKIALQRLADHYGMIIFKG